MIPNYLADVEAAKVKYPDAWAHAHHEGDPRRLEWIKLFATDLHAKDPKCNLNGKRGNPNDLSADAINILCDAADSAGRTPEGLPCVVVDVIKDAGLPTAAPAWGVYNTVVEGSGASVKPTAPAPPTPTIPSYEALGGDEGAKKITRILEHDYKFAGRPGLDGDCGAWLRRTDYDFLAGLVKPVEASITKHRDEWLGALGLILSTPVTPSTIENRCKICGASVVYEAGKPAPLIPHTADCVTR